MKKLHNINAENFKPNGLKQQFMKTFNEWKKQFGRAALIGTAAMGLLGGTMMFTGCPNPAGTTIDPDPIEKPDPIPQSKFETPRTKNYGDFVMYNFENRNWLANANDASIHYTKYTANLNESIIDELSDKAKENPIIQKAINQIKNAEYKGSINYYHDDVENALAPIFQDMTKRNIELGDVDDRYNWEGCCRYMFNEAYGHGLGDRINENRPETEKYQAEQKDSRMIVNTDDIVQYGNTRDEATANMINHYLVMLSADMNIPVKDLKNIFQMEFNNKALTPVFDVYKTSIGYRQSDVQSNAVVGVISDPYQTLEQTRVQ